MYKRDRFVFVSNLKDVTCDPTRPNTHLRDAYLLSEKYTTKKRLALATFAKGRKNTLFSDNGNFSRMRAIAKAFDEKGSALLKQVKEDGLTAAHRKKRDALWKEIYGASEAVMNGQDFGKIVGRQLQMDPHALIGLEDFTIPVLQMSGLLQSEMKPRAIDVAEFQRKTKSLFLDEVRGRIQGVELPEDVVSYLVLHAYNYSSAAQGGRSLRKRKEVNAIAISYGATMRSPRWITEIRLGRKRVTFDEKLPEKYLVSQALTLGAINGLERKVRVHLLGVGSPIMIVLSGLFAPRTIGLSIDSTAPFMDGDDGVIYGSRRAFLKMKMNTLAAHLLIDGKSYDSKQPFWKEFNQKYPSDWRIMREKMGINSLTDPRKLAKALRSEQVLVRKHIPFFTRIKGGGDPFMLDLRVARAGTNYWVIKEVVDAVRRKMSDPRKLQAWVKMECERYQLAAHPKWSKAVREAYRISVGEG